MKMARILDWVCNNSSSMHRLSNSSPLSSLLYLDFNAFRLLLMFLLSFGLLILELSWIVIVEQILVLIWKCFGFIGSILFNLRCWFASTRRYQFLACFL